ncbi:ATP-binding cassette domain-containing protein [Humibacillus xanthopallidus]|uniref:ATP-binding cassette domain-containing protein n=1 Tax=Humibacillus xanthopallidus TaxID=412689 RepID=UPI00384B488C
MTEPVHEVEGRVDLARPDLARPDRPAPAAPASRPPQAGPAGARVEVAGLSWRPYGRARPVLDGLDLSIAAGERVLLAGPSGSGKSTLLRALAGLLLTADSGELAGEVTLDGEPEHRPGTVGLVLQDPGAGVVASTIGRDVAFGLENVGLPREAMPARVAAALAEVGLDLPPDASPLTLSGGEAQRLALAGALVMEPRLLLLDEPTAMLDATTAAGVRQVVAELVERRRLTLVVVEHRLDGWIDLVDRLVVLDLDGRVVADGRPDDVLAHHADSLVQQGIWVPGAPEPQPLPVALTAAPRAAAGSVAAGQAVVAGIDIGVERRSRRLGSTSRSTTAVAGVDLDVVAGQVTALTGPSGAGKTTLMAAVGGLLAPTTGRVAVAAPLTPTGAGDGSVASGSPEGATGRAREGSRRPVEETSRPPHEWASVDLARVVAWVPQRAATAVVGRTVRDDVLTTARALGHDDADAETRADELLATLGLTRLAGTDPRHLSGGEQRRLAVASAIAHGPALVLADEPTVGQDRLTWAAVMGTLEAARREGAGVLVTTHDPGVVARADREVALRRPPQPPPDPEPERQPLLARVGPLALLVAALCVLPLPALLGSWRQGLVVLGVELTLGLIGLIAPGPGRRPQGRLRGVLARLAPAAVAVAGVAWSAWLLGGRDLEIAAGAAVRVLCLIVPSAFVVGFIDPERLGDHLAQRLRLPARPVVAATAALQRLQSFDDLWTELMTTRRVRGIRADRGLVRRGAEAVAVTGGLLVGALGQAAGLALAMDARGFAEAHRRSWAGSAPWRLPDSLAVLAGLVVIGAAVAARSLVG